MDAETTHPAVEETSVHDVPRHRIPAGWEVLLHFLLSLGAAVVNDKLCLLVLGGGAALLVWRHRETPAAVMGIIFAIACEAPLLRRIHDLRHGFVPSSVILIAPFCAYPLLGVLLVKRLPSFRKGMFVPMILTSFGIIWAYGVGLPRSGVFPASIQLLQYASCMIVYAYIVVNFDRFRMKSFHTWILAVGGLEAAYGIFQWVSPPAWDVAWFKATGVGSAAGVAVPFMLRSFGTLNGVSHFASFLFFVLVVAVEARGFLFVAPLVAGALGTTLVRTLWGGVAFGWAVNLLVAGPRLKFRLLGAMGGTILIMGLAALPFSSRLESLTKRMNSMGSMGHDNSLNERKQLLNAAIQSGAMNDPVGVGLGGTGAAARMAKSGLSGIDNGFIQMLWLFGWVGSALYFSGFLWAVVRSFGKGLLNEPGRIPFLGVVAALFVSSVIESSFEDFKGVMLWMSLGIMNAPRLAVFLPVGDDDSTVDMPVVNLERQEA